MSVDDRDFFAETITIGFVGAVTDPWLVPPPPPKSEPNEPPPFLAMGTVVELPAFVALGTQVELGEVDAEMERPAFEDDLEVTQPIPKMTMAELVFACRAEPTKLAEPVVLDEPLARGSMAMMPIRLDDELVEVKARPRALGTIPPMSVDAQPQGVAQVEMPAAVPPTSRKIRPRRTRPRARTIAPRRLTSVEIREVANTESEQAERPRTRAECAHEQRPCPWVSCKHHLYLDVNPRTGSIKLNFPDLEPWELQHTCALDVADAGGHTLEEVGDITNLTRERIRQLEFRGLLELRGRSRTLR
ncbi:MAG: sigma factor-like helix-turn-helix DNA-binding protein [Kofleriaceae bacterium]